jgi:fructose/tagatose bisphosphate aldolase
LPINENCRLTKEVVLLAHSRGVAVEAEVGSIGGEEDGYESKCIYPTFEDILQIGTKTGIDCVAIGFGNVHGEYKSKSDLRWEIYEKGYFLTGLPLVLHGGSGLDLFEFKRAILAGTAKINISTDLKKIYLEIFESENINDLLLNPMTLHTKIQSEITKAALHYINIFK